jgi:hypothetical protein
VLSNDKITFHKPTIMNKELLKIGIRYNAVYIGNDTKETPHTLRETTANLVANLSSLGYAVDESLLRALNTLGAPDMLTIYYSFTEVLQVGNNWMPLVKGWDIPTGEKREFHLLTAIANMFRSAEGTRLACGHLIPYNTFPLERYNGCPFCGTPFELGKVESFGQGSKSRLLRLWTDVEMKSLLADLLQSKTALDATQVNSLNVLLKNYGLPKVSIAMKETLISVIDALVEDNKITEAGTLFTTPVDIMRYLWFKKTGSLQIVEPKTIAKRKAKNNSHIIWALDNSSAAGQIARLNLKLKYTRPQCKMVAEWLNNLPQPAEKICELMHPKRSMWVRFIRALRLAEYARLDGMEKLKEIMDVFYNQRYEVWSGQVTQLRLKNDAASTFALLQQRPGIFARSLFANMLWFGPAITLDAFKEVTSKLPARLLVTLSSYAEGYFDAERKRVVKPLGGVSKTIPANPLTRLYTAPQLQEMKEKVEDLCLAVMEERYANTRNESKTIFIDNSLFHVPLAIGDRSETIQDLPSSLMGMSFPLEGNTIRLFMQWGKGLPAQHLDMDLSCQIAYGDKTDVCSFYNLATTGAKHSGDIRAIPDQVGTVEYIDLNLKKLTYAGALYVTFTCNAYSNGSIVPNLVVGWMDSEKQMKITAETGVAYDPSCVQHQIRISRTLAKGLVFGVLDVKSRRIIWLEMPFGGQVVANLNVRNVRALMAKLQAKLTVGKLLEVKAKAQGLVRVADEEEANEAYTRQWAMNTAAVTQLLID